MYQVGLTTLSKVQPPFAGYAVTSEKSGKEFLASCVPCAEWLLDGSVQVVMMSSAEPVIPALDAHSSGSEVFPLAVMTVLIQINFNRSDMWRITENSDEAYGDTLVEGFSRQYQSCSICKSKLGAVPVKVTSKIISLNSPPVQRKGLGGEELPYDGVKSQATSCAIALFVTLRWRYMPLDKKLTGSKQMRSGLYHCLHCPLV